MSLHVSCQFPTKSAGKLAGSQRLWSYLNEAESFSFRFDWQINWDEKGKAAKASSSAKTWVKCQVFNPLKTSARWRLSRSQQEAYFRGQALLELVVFWDPNLWRCLLWCFSILESLKGVDWNSESCSPHLLKLPRLRKIGLMEGTWSGATCQIKLVRQILWEIVVPQLAWPYAMYGPATFYSCILKCRFLFWVFTCKNYYDVFLILFK